MNVVIVAPRGVADLSGLGPGLKGVRVAAVVWADAQSGDVASVRVPHPGGLWSRVRDRVRGAVPDSAVGRTLWRLSGWDDGRWFCTAALRDPDVRSVVRGADLVIAAERDGILTSWKVARLAHRAGRELKAVYGYAAGRAAIEDGTR